MKIIEKIYKRKFDYSEDLADFRVEVTAINYDDEKLVVSFGEGEPEDMFLYRDLNDAYNILDLAIMCYEAGKNGETLEFERVDVEDE